MQTLTALFGGISRVALIGASLVTPLIAEEAKPADEQTIEQLKEAYSRLDGYSGTYHSEKKHQNAILDVTVAMDDASGLAVIWMNATKDGKPAEMRQWSTPGGTIYMGGGDDLYRLDVYSLGTRLFSEMKEVAWVEDKDKQSFLSPSVIPSVGLEKEMMGMSLGLGNPNVPPWSKWIEGARIKESTDDSVTFATDGHGDLTISRKTGLLVKQSMPDENGGERLLELKDLRLNPGQGEVAKISTGWKTEGAKPMEGDMVTLFRRKFVVALVDAVDEGEIKLTDLDKFLKEKHEALEDFVAGSVGGNKKSLALHPMWDAMLDKNTLKKGMKAVVEKGALKDVHNDEELEECFSKREKRTEIRDGFIKGLLELKTDGLTKKALGESLGMESGVSLSSKTADGKAAAELVERALARAYFTVMFDRKMLKSWGPPKD